MCYLPRCKLTSAILGNVLGEVARDRMGDPQYVLQTRNFLVFRIESHCNHKNEHRHGQPAVAFRDVSAAVLHQGSHLQRLQTEIHWLSSKILAWHGGEQVVGWVGGRVGSMN